MKKLDDLPIPAQVLAAVVIVGSAILLLAGYKFFSVRQAIAKHANFAPPPEAVTSIDAAESEWHSSLSAVGSVAAWPLDSERLLQRLPQALRTHVDLVEDWTDPVAFFDAAICHGDIERLMAVSRSLAERQGPIVSLTAMRPGESRVPLERLVVERALSVNTAAAGGNASLMTIG